VSTAAVRLGSVAAIRMVTKSQAMATMYTGAAASEPGF